MKIIAYHFWYSAILPLFVYVLYGVQSLNILGIFPHAAKSHVHVFLPIMTELAKRGHNVTVLSHFITSPLPANVSAHLYHQFTFDLAQNEDLHESVQMQWISGRRYEKYITGALLTYLGVQTCYKTLIESPTTARLLQLNNRAPPTAANKFDLFITEFFNTDCFASVAYWLRVPMVGLASSILMPWSNDMLANPTHPAYIPHHFLDHSDRMDRLLERVENTMLQILNEIVYKWYGIWWTESYVRSFNDRMAGGGATTMPPFREMTSNLSVLLINTHVSLNLARPLVPGIIEIGGVHLATPSGKKLSENIERWLNEAREGVIFFSMGSMIKGHTFPADKRQAFLKAFSRFPEHRVLWKWENDTMDGERQPLPNVMLQRWMPQFDILCHPNVKAFISHGGLLSTIEAVHCGVPVVIMPQFGDQFTNARALEANGGGLTLHLADADESSIYDALLAALSPKLQLSSHQLSERFRDRPLPPLDTAIYWVEYVARHKGAYHMRTAAVNMPLYQYLLLDVLAFVIVVFMIISIVCIYITKWLWRKIFASREQNTKKKSS